MKKVQFINTSTPTLVSELSYNDLETKIKWFELYGKRGKTLNLLYSALLTIQPTSTSSERVFSVSANFLTKTRSRMSKKMPNILVFLKYY
jgi:hypothetical protein